MTLEHVSRTAVPAARIDDLVMTESGDEVLVYDQKSHHIHHLNQTSAAIWRLCDGQRGVSSIAAEATAEVGTEVNETLVRLALRKLDDAALLDGVLATEDRGSGQSRRAFIKKAAVAGAIAVPTIVSVSAPAAAISLSVCLQLGGCAGPEDEGDECCKTTGSGSSVGTCNKNGNCV